MQTRGVEKMLRRIGFRYAERVDPFDGGPHFTAPTDEVSLVQRAHAAKVAQGRPRTSIVKNRSLVAVESKEPPFFRCVLAACAPTPTTRGDRSAKTRPRTSASTSGDEVWVLPMD